MPNTVDKIVIVAWYAASSAMTGYKCKLTVKTHCHCYAQKKLMTLHTKVSIVMYNLCDAECRSCALSGQQDQNRHVEYTSLIQLQHSRQVGKTCMKVIRAVTGSKRCL